VNLGAEQVTDLLRHEPKSIGVPPPKSGHQG
jgi:hypothetical protein